jgi:hypothetical protein
MTEKRIDFIIMGAQKCGTTSAARNLSKHPELNIFSGITEYGQYEIEFFNQHWDRGVDWYYDQLPRSNGLIGEKTAELFHRKICHLRIRNVQPNVKLIVLLRCPIERSYSQWRMAALKKGDEHRSFDEVIQMELQSLENESFKDHFHNCEEREITCWREGYILKGFYYELLINLYELFPKENIYIGISEHIRKNMDSEYNMMFTFLQVPKLTIDCDEHFVGKQSSGIKNETLKILKQIYRKPNLELFDFLGYKIHEWQ